MSEIISMYSSLLNPNIQNMTPKGLEAYQKELQDKYQSFTDAVWKATPHDDDAVKPEVPLTSQNANLRRTSTVEADIKKANRLLMGMRLDKKLHSIKDAELSGALNLSDAESLKVAMGECGIRKGKNGEWEFVNEDCRTAAIELCLAYAERMTGFTQQVNDICAESKSFEERKTIPDINPWDNIFKGTFFSQSQLEALFAIMKKPNDDERRDKKVRYKEEWISPLTQQEDFLFYFGRGEIGQPREGIIYWRNSVLMLTFFLEEMTDEPKGVWTKASRIFMIWDARTQTYKFVNPASLRTRHCQGMQSDKRDEYIQKVRALIEFANKY